MKDPDLIRMFLSLCLVLFPNKITKWFLIMCWLAFKETSVIFVFAYKDILISMFTYKDN